MPRISKDTMKSEIRKCGQDPVYFLKNYVKISHPLKGLIPFTTYDFQDELLNDFKDNRFNIILKARQLGISTIVAGYAAWLLLFRREKQVMVVATKFKTAANLVIKVKKMLKTLPDWMMIADIKIDNQSSFELSNGSKINASTTSAKDAGRSESLSLLIVDEAAFVEGMEELWTGILPTISTGGRCIALSTPNGVGNWFYKTYVDAESETNLFKATVLPWDVHPDRDDEWFREQTKNMSRREIAQEFECSFNMSGETVVSPDDMGRLTESVSEPKYKTGFDRNYWIWQEPQAGVGYLVSADVARGDGADSSVFHVFRIDTFEQVAEYQGKPNHDMFAMMLDSVGKEYGNALLVVENNNIGYNVLDKLQTLEYPNLYYSTKSTHEFVDHYTAEFSNSVVPGFSTTSKTRPLIIAKMEEFIRNKIIKINSPRTIREFETFVWNNGKPSAMRGYNDDLIMAISIGCWVKDVALTTNKRETAYGAAILNSMIKSNSQINTTIPGMIGYSTKQDPFKENFKQRQDAAKKQIEEFLWLYKG
jgi:uncharacterized protein YeaC (DUF1315 family)